MASRIYLPAKILIPNTTEMMPKLSGLISASRFYCSGTSFTSKYNSKILYPNHGGIDQTVELPSTGKDGFSGFIPVDKLEITYSRSRGPGGQHVNTANTKVDLRFHINKATWISDTIKNKLATRHATLINKDGYLVIKSDKTRSGHMNLADCMEKLRAMIYKSTEVPKQPDAEDLEMWRKRKQKANQMRLRQKSISASTKAGRRSHD